MLGLTYQAKVACERAEMTEQVKKMDVTYDTEHYSFVVKGADNSIFDNFDYDELVAMTFALTQRADSLRDTIPRYAKYLDAIANKLADFA